MQLAGIKLLIMFQILSPEYIGNNLSSLGEYKECI